MFNYDFLPNLPESSLVFVQDFEELHDMVSIVKLSASHENYSIAKRSKSFQYNPWLLDAENFQKTKGLLNVKLLLSLSKLCDLKGKYDLLFSLDIFIPTHSLTSSLLTLTQTDLLSQPWVQLQCPDSESLCTYW